MRILVASDLHLEYMGNLLWYADQFLDTFPTDVDFVVLAGDIYKVASDFASLSLVVKLFTQRWNKVVYVPGNHDYWSAKRATVTDTHRAILEVAAENDKFVPLLNNNAVIDGVTIAGSPLWFPVTSFAHYMEDKWCDFLQIKDALEGISRVNTDAINFFRSLPVGMDLWVTHHAPSWLSVEPKFAGFATNEFFVSPQMEEIIREKQPKYHIHGHMHLSVDYKIGETKVISNPYGYHSSIVNPNFRKDFVIEL